MTFKTRTISYDARVRVFWTLALAFIACLIIYIYAVDQTVRNTVARANLEAQTSALSVQVGQMEFSYIAMEDKIFIDLAYARGFKDVTDPIYISQTDARALSMNVLK